MNSFARLVSGRRSKFAVLALWLAALAAMGPLIGQFESKQKNEPSSFLPAGAESVRALALSDQFPSAEGVAAIAVFSRPEGLTGADRAAIADVQAELAASPPEGVVAVEPAAVLRGRRDRARRHADRRQRRREGAHRRGRVDIETRSLLVRPTVSRRRSPARPATPPTRARRSRGSTPRSSSPPRPSSSSCSSSSTEAPSSGSSRSSQSSSRRGSYAESGRSSSRRASSSTGRPGGILLVLVFGAGTDYALLLTARYREELHRHEDKHEAMRIAVRQAGPGILASAGTVVAALLCLSFASVNSTAGLGPVGAMGVAVAATAMLTVLPALLLIGGRRAFWPFVPRLDHSDGTGKNEIAWRRGFWGRLGAWIERRHRAVWIVTTLALLALDARHAHARLEPDHRERLPRRGRGRRGAEAPRALVSGRRERTDDRDRHRSRQAGRRARRSRAGAGGGRAWDVLRTGSRPARSSPSR